MPLQLFARFPGTASLPHVPLASLPTLLEPMRVAGLDVRSLSVKRDDLTAEAYGGNKVRKLEFLLGQAVAERRCAVITFGAYGSNHALATAVHARALGLEPHVVLSPQAPTPFARATLLAHVCVGSVIHVVEGWDGAREAVRVRSELAERDFIEPLVIPMGGTSPLGALGYVNAALEVAARAPDVVYVAAGTLGTAVGLAVGFAAAGCATRVEAVRVTPAELANAEVARTLAEGTVALLRTADATFPEPCFPELALEIRDEFFEPGYGVVTSETLEAVTVAAGAGITLETTYTGKAFSALIADAHAGRLAGADVLFWDTYHSGPMPAPGPVEALPPVLQVYVAECERLFGASQV